MKGNRLIIISAPSGTGKTSVIQRLLVTHPNMIHSVSCTTRPKRGAEVDGKDYHFIPQEIFQQWIKEGKFVEWAKVHHRYYGTLKAPLDQALQEGKDVVLDLDVEGGMALKKIYGERALTLFLLPPSVEELERRLSERGTDSPEERQIRLDNAHHELAHKDRYDHQIMNDNLKHACEAIEKLLKQD
ncbi:MAG: guanylate kinase [Deltaproteobacteria bacterium RIFCSPLOWO2_02_FULL_46_8]|nr:MAG: guanylate kinase [Deltaproteobacteria bacterium RIFCSPLOWO2_02_FULL_46_8]